VGPVVVVAEVGRQVEPAAEVDPGLGATSISLGRCPDLLCQSGRLDAAGVPTSRQWTGSKLPGPHWVTMAPEAVYRKLSIGVHTLR